MTRRDPKPRNYNIPLALASLTAIGATAFAGCSTAATAENQATTGPAVPGASETPSGEETSSHETGAKKDYFNTPLDDLKHLTANEVFNIPSDLDAKKIQKVATNPGAIYDMFRKYMVIPNAEDMSDEQLATEVASRYVATESARDMMFSTPDINLSDDDETVIERCNAARNGAYGLPRNETMGRNSEIGCVDNYRVAKGYRIFEKDFTPTVPNKKGMQADTQHIKVISRGEGWIKLKFDTRGFRTVDPDMTYYAGLPDWPDDEALFHVQGTADFSSDGTFVLKNWKIDAEK